MPRPRPIQDTVVVWFSCGAPSAVAAKLTLERYPQARVLIVNTPIAEEDKDNQRFLRDVSDWLGRPIISAINFKFPDSSAASVWKKHRYMAGPTGARCTKELKKEARYQFEKREKIDWHVFGFAADEVHRHQRFITQERENVLPVLIDAGLTKQQCVDRLLAEGLRLPDIYKRGYPNANCLGCVKVTSPTYWNHLRVDSPQVFRERCEQSRALGVRLVEVGKERIFLDELDPAARGRPMKSLKFDCGIFCDMDESQ